ncbi:MAG TPA: endonuclease/exonuclease/phosphatase family protein [Polyangiaceae bacterium]|jgi:endonuclease/exonuclease/phosphatase family metal-dependent hydrolase
MAVTLATFNVKDLLEPRLDAKLAWIAAAIARCDADVVGLQEIGPPALLDAVVDRIAPAGSRGGYLAPLVGTADARGIRCALLSRLPPVHAQVHTTDALPFPVFRVGDPPPFGARIPLRRGIVHARVDAPGLGLVDVFVAHFKSSRPVPLRDAAGSEIATDRPRGRAEGTVRGMSWRAAEALFVRGLVDDVQAARSDALVAVMGDLNDVPDSPVLRVARGEGPGELLDCAARVEARERFSTIHDGRRIQIDHVLASPPLYAHLASARFVNEGLRMHDPLPPSGVAAPTVDSDHAPFVVRFG